VIGLAFSGMGIGILVVGPVAQFLIVQVGWRQANLLLGSATLSLLVPLLWFGVKNAPPASSEVGSRRGAGGSSTSGFPVRSREEPDAAAPLGPTVREALATRPFWALFFAFLFTPLAVMPVFTHQVVFAVDQGFSRMFVASIFGLTGLLSSVGRVGFGMISDRIGRELSATLSFGCTAGGTLVLLFLEILPHPGLLYAYAILFGLGFGARGPIVTAMATDFFGGKRFGAIYGILNFGNGIGAAVGPWFSGVVHDATGSYRWAFLTSVGFCVVAAACFWAATSRGADAR
jgi:MFS family permease